MQWQEQALKTDYRKPKRGENMEQMMYTADDVATMLQVSKSKAYQVIASLNKELKDLGKLTVRGKINKRYFEKS